MGKKGFKEGVGDISKEGTGGTHSMGRLDGNERNDGDEVGMPRTDAFHLLREEMRRLDKDETHAR